MKKVKASQINIAPRQVLFVLLFLESVVIAIALAKAIARDLSPAHYFGENGLSYRCLLYPTGDRFNASFSYLLECEAFSQFPTN